MECSNLHHISHQEDGRHRHHDSQDEGGIADGVEVAGGIAHLLLLVNDVLYRWVIPNRIDCRGVFWVYKPHVECSRQRIRGGLFHHHRVGVLEKFFEPLIGICAVAVFHGLDGIIRLQLFLDIRTGRTRTVWIPSRNILIELNHDLDAVEIDFLGVLGQVGHHDAGDNEPDRNRGSNDHGDGHGQIAAQTLCGFAENKS